MIEDLQDWAWILEDARAVERVVRELAKAPDALTSDQRTLWRLNTLDVERGAESMHGRLDAMGQRIWDAALALAILRHPSVTDGKELVRLTLGQADATSAAATQIVREHTLAERDRQREEALNGNGGDRLPRRL